MDSKTFTTRLAKASGLDNHTVGALTSALVESIADAGAALDSVAIPGFGTFQSAKTDEHIETHPESGRRMLMPPAIELQFQPSVVLRKKLRK